MMTPYLCTITVQRRNDTGGQVGFLLLVLKSQQKHKKKANNPNDKPRRSAELSVKPGRSGKRGRATEISAGKRFAHYLNRTQLQA